MQGSWKFYCLSTGAVITRDSWNVIPMPRSVVDHMNTLADTNKRGPNGSDPTFSLGNETIKIEDKESKIVPFEEPTRIENSLKPDLSEEPLPEAAAPMRPTVSIGMPGAPEAAERTNAEPIVAPGKPPATAAISEPSPEPAQANQETAADEPKERAPITGVETPEQAAAPPTPERRYPLRANRSNWREKYGFHLSFLKAHQLWGTRASEAVRAELLQMLDLKVWTVEDVHQLTMLELRATIYSSMFLKEKFHPDGTFDKLKARLVANGNQQDRSLYETSSVSSPAVALSSVFMGAGIAAAEGRHVVTMDIIGAYLKINMTGKVVRVRLPPPIAKSLCELWWLCKFEFPKAECTY